MNLSAQVLDFLTGIMTPLLIAGLAMGLSRLAIQAVLWLTSVRRQRMLAHVVPVDVTGQAELPQILMPVVSSLEEMDFERVGEAEVIPPGRPPMTMWILAEPNRMCHVEVSLIQGMPIVLFVTMFSAYTNNRAFAVTAYPSGPQTEQPDYIAHTVEESLDAAYRHQRLLVEHFRETPLAQFRVDSMDQFIEYSRIYNIHFAGRLGGESRRRRLGGIASSAYDVVVFGGLTAASLWLNIPHSQLVYLILPLLLSMILVHRLLEGARAPTHPKPGGWRRP
ncbi:MAG: hypothetical protein JXJ17_09105 [Anaerolineae bacterium]|nr:hypothetical protein [Anaerolineae bacterium]